VKAMIFAAGIGSRLLPLTKNTPKALVLIGNITLIERVILKLIDAGFTDIIINLHHFPDKIKTFIKSKGDFNIRIEYSHEFTLLDTGGGLAKAAHFFADGKPFLVHNTDVLSTVDLKQMLLFHEMKKPLATLFVQNRKSSRYLLFDRQGQLAGWKNAKTNQTLMATETMDELSELAFNGIHIIEPEFFELINKQGSFPIIPEYIELAKSHRILAYQQDNCKYLDAGKPDSIAVAEKMGF